MTIPTAVEIELDDYLNEIVGAQLPEFEGEYVVGVLNKTSDAEYWLDVEPGKPHNNIFFAFTVDEVWFGFVFQDRLYLAFNWTKGGSL